MADHPFNSWQSNLSALLAAETEQDALEVAVMTIAELLDGPTVGVLKGRAEYLSSMVARGQDGYVAPLFVEALWMTDPRLASKQQSYQELFEQQQVTHITLRDEKQTLGAICAIAGPGANAEAAQIAVLELALVRTVQRIRRLAETHLLYQISLRLSSTLDLPQLLHEILELTLATFLARSSRIFLADERDGTLVMTFSPREEAVSNEQPRIPIDGTVAGWVVQHGNGMICNDSHDGRFQIEVETGQPLSKLVCAPLKQADRTLGAIMLVNQHDDPDFQEDDLRLLTTIAGTVAIAIANARLYQRAIRDALTGAYNRGAFDNALREHWINWEKTGAGFGLIILDLDNFKQINDRFGHSTGDATLQAVTRILWETLREEDSIYRYGGEEFGVLLSQISDEETLAQVAERVRAALDHETTIGGLVRVRISASIGAALHPYHGAQSTQALLDLADEAAYRAKRAGKNRVVLAPPEPSGAYSRHS